MKKQKSKLKSALNYNLLILKEYTPTTPSPPPPPPPKKELPPPRQHEFPRLSLTASGFSHPPRGSSFLRLPLVCSQNPFHQSSRYSRYVRSLDTMQGQFSARHSRRRGGPPTTSYLSTTTYKARVVEGAGRATAECAAVWCCCPCGIANLILFAAYRIPAGICRRAIRSRRQRRKGRGMLGKGGGCQCDMCEGFSVVGRGENGGGIVMLGDLLEMKGGYGDDGAAAAGDGDGNDEVRLLDEEMLKKFYETGFWRSPSRIYQS